MGKNLSKSVKILVSEQTALAALLYFRQVFVFCRLIINKKVLEWFLLIMCEEHTRTELCFCLRREGRQMASTVQLLFQTGKAATGGIPLKSSIYKFCKINRKRPVLKSLFQALGLQTY